MALIPKGGTIVPAGTTFPVIREAVYAADLASLNAMDSAQCYLGMLGVIASAPGVVYTATSLSPLIWTALNSKLKDPVITSLVGNKSPLSGLTPNIDGVVLSEGDRVLLRGQLTATQNGIYIASAGAWTRAPDFDAAASLAGTVFGSYIFVSQGTTFGRTSWTVTAGTNPPIIGTTVLTFSQIAPFSALAPATVTNLTGSGGSAIEYARRDHSHQLVEGTWRTIAGTVSADWSNNNRKIVNVGNATNGADAVNLNTLNTTANNVAFPARYRFVRALSLTPVTKSGPQTIDGVACVAGDYVFLLGEATATGNGIHIVQSGAWSVVTGSLLNIPVGMIIHVVDGLNFKHTTWISDVPYSALTTWAPATDPPIFRMLSRLYDRYSTIVNDATPTAIQTFQMGDEQAHVLDVLVQAREVNGLIHAAWQVQALVYRNGGLAIIEGVPNVTVIGGDNGGSWAATIEVTGNAWHVMATSDAAATVKWTCSVQWKPLPATNPPWI